MIEYTVVLVLIIVIVLYLILNMNNVTSLDLVIIVVSVSVLLYSALYSVTIREKFIEIPPLINIEEDLTGLPSSCVIYNTIYNKASYDPDSETSKDWISVMGDNQRMIFDKKPIYKPSTGLYLGNNKLTGPNSHELGIDFINQYTILLVCKHGNLVPTSSPTTGTSQQNNSETCSSTSNTTSNPNLVDVEILKLYATNQQNSNSNGLTISIKGGSISTINNVQVGTLNITYADGNPQPCLVTPTDNLINFDKDVLTFYFIIKEKDTFKIQRMTETNPTISTIFSYNPPSDPVKFSNQPLFINRLMNWNANIFHVSIFKESLTDNFITQLYHHIMAEYMKRVDPNFGKYISDYNDTINYLTQIKNCPFNAKKVCQDCQISNWQDMNSIITASQQCRTSINDFCKGNPSHAWCKPCWNANSKTYNTENCLSYRSVFAGKNIMFENLTPEELSAIAKKYSLVSQEECTKVKEKKDAKSKEVKPQDIKVEIPIDIDESESEDETDHSLYHRRRKPRGENYDIITDYRKLQKVNNDDGQSVRERKVKMKVTKDVLPPIPDKYFVKDKHYVSRSHMHDHDHERRIPSRRDDPSYLKVNDPYEGRVANKPYRGQTEHRDSDLQVNDLYEGRVANKPYRDQPKSSDPDLEIKDLYQENNKKETPTPSIWDRMKGMFGG